MKVLFATYPMAFHTPGGGEVQLLAYERQLPRLGVEVTRFDSWAPRFLEHDIVHFFSAMGGSSHFCAFVKALGLPLVVSSSLWITEATLSDFPVEEIRHQLFLADRVVTNSPSECETLARVLQLPQDKFVTVRNAVDERFLAPADPAEFRRAFGIEGDFVLCVGNIEPRKNQLRLAEAMRAFPELRFVLVGAVRDPAYFTAVEAVGGTQMTYLGSIDHQAGPLPSAYAACRVFALPSLFETPGLAALEASAQGAPLVLTREGSSRDYFADTAFYVDPTLTTSIAAAIGQALQASRDLPDDRIRPYTPPTWAEVTADLNAVYRGVLPAKIRDANMSGANENV